MRIFGWSLVAVGALLFARTAWLRAMYFENMSVVSQQRFYILITTAPLVVAIGIWVVMSRRGR
jgi:hypothetical protein